ITASLGSLPSGVDITPHAVTEGRPSQRAALGAAEQDFCLRLRVAEWFYRAAWTLWVGFSCLNDSPTVIGLGRTALVHVLFQPGLGVKILDALHYVLAADTLLC